MKLFDVAILLLLSRNCPPALRHFSVHKLFMVLPAGDRRQFQNELVGERGAELPQHLHDCVQMMQNSSHILIHAHVTWNTRAGFVFGTCVRRSVAKIRSILSQLKNSSMPLLLLDWTTATHYCQDIQFIPLITCSQSSEGDHSSPVLAALRWLLVKFLTLRFSYWHIRLSVDYLRHTCRILWLHIFLKEHSDLRVQVYL